MSEQASLTEQIIRPASRRSTPASPIRACARAVYELHQG
jgi:hypothetical protein